LRKQQEKKMASDSHLKLEGVDGESTHADHKGEIEISSWSWGLTNAANISGGGMGVGKARFGEISFTHKFDKASTVLAKHCAAGKHFSTAKLTSRKAGEGQKDFLIITLKEVFITNISINAQTGGEVNETFSCNYKDIEIAYKAQDGKGGLTGEVKFGFDIGATKGR
jgi:type VI secretion system secreted protein Hcp